MYGIAIVINECEDTTKRIPYIFIGGFDPMCWFMNEDKPSKLRKYNAIARRLIKNEPIGYTNIERLMTAPADAVIVVGKGENWRSLEDRKPLNASNGIYRDGVKTDEKGYLNVD